jgi:hypothetical protein
MPILIECFKQLDPEERATVRMVCKNWKEAVMEMNEKTPYLYQVIQYYARRENKTVLEWYKYVFRSEYAYVRDKLPNTTELCRKAAKSGHLETLKALKCLNLPMDASVTSAAAKNKHWEVLEWLLKNGCKYDFEDLHYRVPTPIFDLLQYLENGVLYDPTTYEEYTDEYDCHDD